MKKKLELLAPAQNKECAIAAINYGADAVYMGAMSYGARSKAGNSLEDIQEVVNFAHKFSAKVYVTVNTILSDKEIVEAQELICKLYEIGVDAVIIQDMGLLKLELPPIKIFASTQCDIRTLEKVKFLEEVGFSRVILARELSLKEIEHICKNTKIEIETFVHGALCVSYSGQCYLSHACGGRSANRGECAQACRRQYTLVDEKGKILLKDKHLLNLKDFNASAHIDELVKAGVTSFKIEGRMKDVNYLKNVVGHYRKLLDKYPCSASGKVFFDFESNPEKSFNRGFCDYFLKGDKKAIHNLDTPKSMGEKLGAVSEIGKDYFCIQSDKRLNPQDGLCAVCSGELTGCLVNTVSGKKIFPNKMPKFKKGDVVYRNSDAEFEKKLESSKTMRKLAVTFNVFENEIQAVDEDGNIVSLPFDAQERAQNQEKMLQTITAQLQKSGESDFYVEKVDVQADNLPFLPVSRINELRRNIFSLLIDKRLENHKIENFKREPQTPIKRAKFTHVKVDYKSNIHNSNAKTFMQECGCRVQEFSLESGTSVLNKELMRCKYCIKRALNKCKNDEKLYLIDGKNKKFRLEFDCKNCEMVLIKEKT